MLDLATPVLRFVIENKLVLGLIAAAEFSIAAFLLRSRPVYEEAIWAAFVALNAVAFFFFWFVADAMSGNPVNPFSAFFILLFVTVLSAGVTYAVAKEQTKDSKPRPVARRR